MAVLNGQQLLVLGLNSPNANAVEQQWVRITERGRLRVAVQAADGSLYMAADANPGEIFRVVGTPPA